MKLTVISYPESLTNEAQLINRLFQHKLERFHLRKPLWEPAKVEQLIVQVEKQYHSMLIIHDHFQCAEKYGLGGIHFSASTKPQMEQWMQFPGSKSVSCHSLEEMNQLPLDMDYAFLSPVFHSISKKGYLGMQKLHEVGEFLKTYSRCKVFALGGIDTKNIAICRKVGFDGVAVLGAIWNNDLSEKNNIEHFIKIQKVCLESDPM